MHMRLENDHKTATKSPIGSCERIWMWPNDQIQWHHKTTMNASRQYFALSTIPWRCKTLLRNSWCSLIKEYCICTRLHSKRIVWFSLNWMSITLNLRSVVLFQSNQNSAHNSNQSKWIHMSDQPTCLDSKTVRCALFYHVPVNENPLHGPIWLISSMCNNVCVCFFYCFLLLWSLLF